MKDHIKEYKEKLEKGICEYMTAPVSERSSEAVYKMVKCLKKINELEKSMTSEYGLTADEMRCWNEHMINADGSTGGYWTVDQTTDVAMKNGVEFSHITPEMWNTAMNMIYSDYSIVADKFGVGTPEFYADMAKAFLFDKDGGGPACKMAAYYHGIVDTDY